MRRWIASCASVLMFAAVAAQAAAPTVAVTDLVYEASVREYFRYVEAHTQSESRSSNQGQTAPGASSGSAAQESRHASDYVESAGTYTYIDRGELRGMTGAIKGRVIKSGLYRVVQGKPYLRPERGPDDDAEKAASEKIHDIIERIKQGYFPNADYVLFGIVSSVDFRDEAHPLQGTSSLSRQLSLELVVDFSLINTKTYEVKAGFSATGEGQDVRLVSQRGAIIKMNRGRVISETSRSLAEDVIQQLSDQVGGAAAASPGPVTGNKQETVTTYR
jgi:hypothetical protein